MSRRRVALKPLSGVRSSDPKSDSNRGSSPEYERRMTSFVLTTPEASTGCSVREVFTRLAGSLIYERELKDMRRWYCPASPICVIAVTVKRALHLFLLLGAMIGLFGQAVAYASGSSAMSAPMAMSSMSADCMKMMAQQQQPVQKPCKGMSLDCIAAMGCVVPIVLRDAPPMPASFEPAQVAAFWPTATVLRGSELAPEPEPPT